MDNIPLTHPRISVIETHSGMHHVEPELPATPMLIQRGERQLPMFCPQCGTRVEIRKGLCGNRLIDAIILQSQRIGTELECQRCLARFVHQRLEDLPLEKRLRGHRIGVS